MLARITFGSKQGFLEAVDSGRCRATPWEEHQSMRCVGRSLHQRRLPRFWQVLWIGSALSQVGSRISLVQSIVCIQGSYRPYSLSRLSRCIRASLRSDIPTALASFRQEFCQFHPPHFADLSRGRDLEFSFPPSGALVPFSCIAQLACR